MQNLIRLVLLVSILTITGNVTAGDQFSTMRAGIVIGGTKHTNPNNQRYTCNAAMSKIRLAGFDKIRPVNCTEDHYEFLSTSNGTSLLIKIDSQTGSILNIQPN